MREWIVEHDSECEIIVNYNDSSECELSEYIWFCTYNKTLSEKEVCAQINLETNWKHKCTKYDFLSGSWATETNTSFVIFN